MNSVEYVQQFPLKSFERSEILLKKGDSSDHLMAIREGFIKVTAINSSGVERLLWIAGRYDIAPTEQLFLTNGNVRYFYTALTKGSFYSIDKKSFLKTALENPSLMTEVAKSMSSHYDDFLDRINIAETTSVKERLLRTLYYLARKLSGAPSVDLYESGLQLTHQDFASLIASTRETTSLILNEIRHEKLVDYSRKHFTVHVDKVHQYLEQL